MAGSKPVGGDSGSDEAADAIAQLDLEAVVALTAGIDEWRTAAVLDVGIGSVKLTDGPVGARGDLTSGATSICFPCGSALGATWDVDLVEEIGRALAAEAQLKSAQVLLAPTLNLQRHPLAGRYFESFAEDPELTARLGVAFVRGLQGGGVGAAAKHFACNDQETDRMSIDVEVDERTLREVHLRPFEALMAEAPPWMVMAAYNGVNGHSCTESSWLLADVLRRDWSFAGVVVSDWYATRSTVDAVIAGVDLEMPGPARFLGQALADAVRASEIDEVTVRRRAANVAALAHRAGLSDPGPEAAERSDEDPDRRQLARRAAADGMVLLENDGILPLAPGLRIAVIGPCATEAFPHGGGSSLVLPHRIVTPLEGLRAALGPAAAITTARGTPLARVVRTLRPGLLEGGAWRVEVWPGPSNGAPEVVRFERVLRFSRLGVHLRRAGPKLAGATVRATSAFRPDQSGTWMFRLVASGDTVLRVDDRIVAEHREDGSGCAGFPHDLPRYDVPVKLVAGQRVTIRADLAAHATLGNPRLYVGATPPDPSAEIEQAAAVAAAADVAVVVVGTGPEFETEGEDRADLRLPCDQDVLVAAVAAAQPNTVVVVNAGAPCALPWADRVRAIVWAWFPGQELGHAVSDVLTGIAEPGGRLPHVFPARIEDVAAYHHHPGSGGTVRYAEGVFGGQRHFDRLGLEPAWPMGHGRSYARIDLTLERPAVEVMPSGDVVLRVTAANRSERVGAEVVQVYCDFPEADRPRQLVGFAKLRVPPLARRTATVRCPARAFARWDLDIGSWQVTEGGHVLHVGRSARDIFSLVEVELASRRIPTPAG